MKKYDVTLTAHYQKTVSVCAESPEQAKEKTKIILFDTELINFTDDDFVCGEADITEQSGDGLLIMGGKGYIILFQWFIPRFQH